MNLVQFTDMYWKEVWVNPDRVSTVTQTAGDTTIISFGSDGGNVTLKRPSQEVAHALWNAGKPLR